VAAVDVHYLRTGGARAAAVRAADAAFAYVPGRTHRGGTPDTAYRLGEFYRRELPPLRAVLEDLSGLGLLVVDGYADLDPGGRPGLGAHAHAEFGIPMIGVAKSWFRTASPRCRPCADPRDGGCSSRRPGCPQPPRRTWSGAWPAGTRLPDALRRADTLARTGPLAVTMTDPQPG
jgi:deoxyribonuclease V